MERSQERENRLINTKIIIENTLRSHGIILNNLDLDSGMHENTENLKNFTLLDYINMTTDKIVKFISYLIF